MQNFTLFISSFFIFFFSNPLSIAFSIEKNSDSSQMMNSEIIITEIMYNPAGSDTDWEWIEIYNSSTASIDLSGYVLDDASGVQLSEANIASGVLPPQESAILFDADGVTAEQFKDVWGNVNLIAVTNWSALGNGAGDSIGIWSSFESYDDDNQVQANTVEQVIYKNDEEGWPNDNGSASIYLVDLSADNTIGGNWALSVDGAETPLNAAFVGMELHGNSGQDIGSPGSGEFEDTTPPQIECPETVEIDHNEGECATEIPLLEPSAVDNVSTNFEVMGERSDGLELFDSFPVGTTIITWTVIDEAGNMSLPCEQIVIVIETELPTAIAQNISIELNENGIAILDPQDLDNPETPSFDNCGIAQYLASRTEFDCTDLDAPVRVEFSVLDANGNTSTQTDVLVTVVDFMKPSMNCSEDIVVTITSGNSIIIEEISPPEITDNCDLAPVLTSSRSDAVALFDPFPVGVTTIIWEAVDASGNIEQCAQSVTVMIEEDIVPPTFDVDGNLEDFTTELQVGEPYVAGTIQNIVDDGITTFLISGTETVDTSQSGGPFIVTYQVTDGINTTTITETVFVRNANPEITNFTLVNADTNVDIFELTDGMQIDIATLATLNLNIRATTNDIARSVRLNLTGELEASKIENVAPYALFGDFPQGNYFGRDFGLGMHTISATAFSESRTQGTASETLTVNFSIITICDQFELNIVDVLDVSNCGGTDGFALLEVSGGVAPITYSWSHDPQFSEAIAFDLVAGEYTVTATDANNCSADITFEIKDPDLPIVSLTAFEVLNVSDEVLILEGGLPMGGSYSGQGVSEGIFDPSIGAGTYEITYSFTDEVIGCTASVVKTLEVVETVLSVLSFTLVNAETNEDIVELTEGLQIAMSSLPTLNLNIRANTTDDVQSVFLEITGAILGSRIENVAPYALFGDFPANHYFGKPFASGFYTITADPYSENRLGGKLGTSLTINFELSDLDTAARIFNHANLYPNPAKVETTLSFENPVELLTIYLYDVLGRIVDTYEGRIVKKDGNYVLDISSIPAGNYYIKTHDSQGNEYQKQLIIEK